MYLFIHFSLTVSPHFSVASNSYNYLLSGISLIPTFLAGTSKGLSNMGQRGNGGACQKPSFPHHYSLIIMYLYFIKSCETLATFTFEYPISQQPTRASPAQHIAQPVAIFSLMSATQRDIHKISSNQPAALFLRRPNSTVKRQKLRLCRFPSH